ncbi:MAG: DNA translocase FtsK [Vulcanibacillus sp.]
MARRKSKKRTEKLKRNLKFEFFGIILITFMLIELSNLGEVGHIFNAFFRMLIGTWDFILSLFGIYIALYMMVKRNFPYYFTMRKVGVVLILLSIVLFNHINFVAGLQNNGNYTDVNIISATWQALAEERAGIEGIEIGGGMLGAFIFIAFDYLFNELGTKIIVITLALVGFLLTFNFSYVELFKKIKLIFKKIYTRIFKKIKKKFHLLLDKRRKNKISIDKNEVKHDVILDTKIVKDEVPVIHDFMNRKEYYKEDHNDLNKETIDTLNKKTVQNEDSHEIELKGVSLNKIKEEEENYLLPPFQLLDLPNINDQKDQFKDISLNAKKLESTLNSFGVKVKVTQIHRGPAVTRYEVQPDIGVKVSRIVNLSDDIALSLAAKDIRIEAPIPGKAAIGIEVPNSKISIVSLREVLESKTFFESKSKLSIALGRDVSGEPIIADLTKMPHLLVAGTTGSGKSVCINAMITSILFKAKPSEVKLMMIDPKVVELNVYNGIPHLLAPVVTNPKKASKSLKMIVNEMENRYEKFSEKGARDIERYNELVKIESIERNTEEQILPYIVIIIDELADLMMVAPNDVEESVIRIAQKARAAGIHLIVATQRPTVDVITGLIKANIPSRIAFGVSSQVDSRTIIDIGGAEKLLGRGDMLYLPVGNSKPLRIQGAYISDVEVEQIVTFIKDQQSVNYQNEMVTSLDKTNEEENIEDELFTEAIQLVFETNQASVSLLQRRLRIGYTRAARIIDEMERQGLIGMYEGTKPRKVLINEDTFNKFSV